MLNIPPRGEDLCGFQGTAGMGDCTVNKNKILTMNLKSINSLHVLNYNKQVSNREVTCVFINIVPFFRDKRCYLGNQRWKFPLSFFVALERKYRWLYFWDLMKCFIQKEKKKISECLFYYKPLRVIDFSSHRHRQHTYIFILSQVGRGEGAYQLVRPQLAPSSNFNTHTYIQRETFGEIYNRLLFNWYSRYINKSLIIISA